MLQKITAKTGTNKQSLHYLSTSDLLAPLDKRQLKARSLEQPWETRFATRFQHLSPVEFIE